MSAIFCKKLAKIVPLLKALYKSCVRDSLVLSSVIVRHTVTVHENVSSADYTSGTWLPDCSKLTKNPKTDKDATIFWCNVIVKCFWCYCVSFLKFSDWSKFNINIITGSIFLTIFLYKASTRNLEIGITETGAS